MRNGTINGFYRGIWFEGNSSSWGLVERLRVQEIGHVGIRVEGIGHVVRGNQVVDVVGIHDPANGSDGGAAAIAAFGSAISISNNDVLNTKATGVGNGEGILLNPSDHAVVENNRVINVSGPTNSWGIYIGFSSDVMVSVYRVRLPASTSSNIAGPSVARFTPN